MRPAVKELATKCHLLSQTNLNAPVYLVNVTHIVGAVNPTMSVAGTIVVGTAAIQ